MDTRIFILNLNGDFFIETIPCCIICSCFAITDWLLDFNSRLDSLNHEIHEIFAWCFRFPSCSISTMDFSKGVRTVSESVCNTKSNPPFHRSFCEIGINTTSSRNLEIIFVFLAIKVHLYIIVWIFRIFLDCHPNGILCKTAIIWSVTRLYRNPDFVIGIDSKRQDS